MKKYLLPIITTILIILLATITITILYYFGIINENFNKILIFLASIIALAIGAFRFSKVNNYKIIISSIIYYVIFIIILILANIIFSKTINLNIFIYYVSLYISSITGSYIGKKSKKA